MRTKLLVSILLFLFSLSAYAQYNRRQRIQPRGPVAPQKQRLPEIDVEKAVGMTFYNTEKVIKKIGLKKSMEAFDVLTSIFGRFNKELNQVKRINSFLFYEGKAKIEFARQESFKTKDYSVIQKATKEVTSTFEPIIEVVEEKEKNLDLELEKVLSSKQFKKWIKYKMSVKKK